MGGKSDVDESDKPGLDRLPKLTDFQKELAMATVLAHGEAGVEPIVFPKDDKGNYTREKNETGKLKRIPHPNAQTIQRAHMKLVIWSVQNRRKHLYFFGSGSNYFHQPEATPIRSIATKEQAYSAFNPGKVEDHFRAICASTEKELSAQRLALQSALAVVLADPSQDPTHGTNHYISPRGMKGYNLGGEVSSKYSLSIGDGDDSRTAYDPYWDLKKDEEFYKEVLQALENYKTTPSWLKKRSDQYTKWAFVPPIIIDGIFIDPRWYFAKVILKKGQPGFDELKGYDISLKGGKR